MRALALPIAIVSVLAAFAFAPVPAQAEGIVSFGLGGGVTVPVSDAKDAFKNGVHVHGFAKFKLPIVQLQPRAELLFQHYDVKDVAAVESQFAANTYTGGSQQVVGGLGQLQFNLIKAGPVQPYLVAGLGVANVKTKLDTDTATTVSQNTTRFTVGGGGGVLVKLGPVAGFAEGRLQDIVNNGKVIDFDSVQSVPVTFGLVF